MNAPSRPSVESLNARLAANNARVNRFLETLPVRIDGVLASAAREDWPRLGQVCAELAHQGLAQGYAQLAACAQQVCDEVQRCDGPSQIKRSVVRLLGAYGRTGRCQSEPTSD